MNKSKLAILIDTCFATSLIFITLFFWFRKYIKSAILLLFICILVSLLAFVTIFKYFLKKYNINNLSQKQSKHLKECIKNLKFSSNEIASTFYKKLLNCEQINYNIFENKNYLILINLRTAVTSSDFFYALDLHFSNNKNVIFICDKYDDDFKNLIESNSDYFQIFSTNDLYELMKTSNTFPVNIEKNKSQKQQIKEKVSQFISTITKKHFKDYLFSGISLLAISFFIPYSFYYAIIGTVLLILSIICLLKPSTSAIKNKTSLIDIIKK